MLFLDANTRQPPDSTGANQVGVVVTPQSVLFSRSRRVIESSLEQLRPHVTGVLRLRQPEYREKVAAYFQNHRKHYRLVLTGLRALQVGNLRLFDSPTPMPTAPVYRSREEFERSWADLQASAQVGDSVFTFDQSSSISRAIAWLDRGSWSHVAVCVGNSMIQEAVSAGVVRSELRSYRDTRFHVGLYRPYQPIPNVAASLAYADSTIGARYNYWGALGLGVATVLHRPSRERTPNGLIYGGRLFLVTHV